MFFIYIMFTCLYIVCYKSYINCIRKFSQSSPFKSQMHVWSLYLQYWYKLVLCHFYVPYFCFKHSNTLKSLTIILPLSGNSEPWWFFHWTIIWTFVCIISWLISRLTRCLQVLHFYLHTKREENIVIVWRGLLAWFRVVFGRSCHLRTVGSLQFLGHERITMNKLRLSMKFQVLHLDSPSWALIII